MPLFADTVRLAILGCGQIARVHAERFKKDDRCRVTALYDPDFAAAQRIREQHAPGAALYSRLEEIVSDPNVHAAVICTPTRAHALHVEACRDRGWPVLCEKPLAANRDEIAAIAASCAAGGPPLMVAYQRRFSAIYRTLRREILSGKHGRLMGIASHNSEFWLQQQAFTGTWRSDPEQNPGGFVGDAGSHKVDVVFYVTGLQPKLVFAYQHLCGTAVNIISAVSAQLSGGVPLGMTFLGQAHCFREELHVSCEKGDFIVRDGGLSFAKSNVTRRVLELEPESTPNAAFLDLLTADGPNLAPPECALPVYDFTAALLASARTGAEVKI